jgi:hypothetical protein
MSRPQTVPEFSRTDNGRASRKAGQSRSPKEHKDVAHVKFLVFRDY